MSAVAKLSASLAADQSTRVSSYKPLKPELPSDGADPTATVPPLPSGSVVEKFADRGYVWTVVAILGAIAVALAYRRR
jgi:hypothetical protein